MTIDWDSYGKKQKKAKGNWEIQRAYMKNRKEEYKKEKKASIKKTNGKKSGKRKEKKKKTRMSAKYIFCK